MRLFQNRPSIVCAGLCVSAVIGVLPATLYAKAPGKTGFAFLSLSPFARSSAMGEATSAFVGDAMSVYSNPAGLAHMTASEISVQHVAHVEDMTYDNATAVWAYSRGGWGLNVGMLNANNIPRTKTVPSSVSLDHFVEEGNVEAGDKAVSL